jgi:DNA-binding winged helix-turn-helix (wHTH) protein/Flp pilus assembly protein TadD
MPTQNHPHAVRFGPFVADFAEGHLHKHSTKLKIQSKPLFVLQLLVARPGEVVTREELRRALWADDVFVDFEKNLGTAVNKLRFALGDSADSPIYIETIPRRGYRFLAPVRSSAENSPTVAQTQIASNRVATGSDAATEPEPSVRRSRSQRLRPWLLVAAGVALPLLVLARVYPVGRTGPVLKEKDTIVLADFQNSTGDAVFDDTLKTALGISLRQSPFLNVLSENQVAATLRLMTRPADARLTPAMARDVCLRAGSKAYVEEAIGNLGSEFVLELKAVNCQSGATLGRQQVTAPSKEKALEALGSATTKLRSELGESLASVQSFDVPLEQATTSSLEALKAYTLAQKTARENGAAQSLPYGQRAIELDPNFAMAYEAVGIHYYNLAEPARAAEYLTKAFELREHASLRERLKIIAGYYSSVTGELDKAAQAYQEMITKYPRDIAAYNNLGIVLAEQGQYEKAAEVTKQGKLLAPEQVTLDENLAEYLIALQRFDEARQVIREGQPRKPDNYIFPAALYALAFLSSDARAMAEQEQWFAGKPEYENFGLALAAETEAFYGHLAKSRELTKRAVESALRADRRETGAFWQAMGAQHEAVYGNPALGRRSAAQALRLAPAS